VFDNAGGGGGGLKGMLGHDFVYIVMQYFRDFTTLMHQFQNSKKIKKFKKIW
jgi:hypothetical protein